MMPSSFLDRLPPDRPVALFLRHAERPELPPDPSSHGVELTASGIREAQELGAELGDRLGSVRTSPILRCVQTADALLAGAGRAASPIADLALGNPGPFVADLELAWSEWKRLGHDAVMARLVSGSDDVPGLHPIRRTAKELLAHALACTAGDARIHVFVTHDVVLAPFLVGLLDRGLARDEWPRFLEPLAVHRSELSLRLHYRSTVTAVAHAEAEVAR